MSSKTISTLKVAENKKRVPYRPFNGPKHQGMPWSKEEDKQLVKGFNDRQSISFLSNVHKRTEVAIRSRLQKLNLIPVSYYEYYTEVHHFGKKAKYIRSTDRSTKRYCRD